MKKKVIASALGMMLLSATVLPVYAQDMSVSYSQATTYTLSIPQSIDLSKDSSITSQEIGVSAVNTAPTEKVQVKIKDGITDGKVTLIRKDDSATTVVSSVTQDRKTVNNGSVIAEFQDTDISPVKTIDFSAIEDSKGEEVKAGTYNGTITFEGTVVPR